MVKEDSDKCLPTDTVRSNREISTKSRFDSLGVEIKYPGTAILLLQCQEREVLVAAAAALSAYGSKSQENVEVLLELDVFNSIIPLIEHEDIFTRRFATKLLAEMASVPSVRNEMLGCSRHIPHFAKVLVDDTDPFVQEFTSLILAELSKDMYGAAQLLTQCPNMDFLLERIESPDPDVKKNSIEIMYNVLRDPIAAREIVETKDFRFHPIYELFKQPYPVIQKLALNVVEALVARNEDRRIQELFRQSGGLQELLNVLDREEWMDVHGDALKLLTLACDNAPTAELLCSLGGIAQLLEYTDRTSNSQLVLDAFNVIVRLADTSDGRKALHSYGIVDYLLKSLRDTTQLDMCGVSCQGIGKMSLLKPVAEELTLKNPIENISDILKNENAKWSVRRAAAFALRELFLRDRRNCENFLKIKGQAYLLCLIGGSLEKVPSEVLITAVQCLTTIASRPEFRSELIDVDLLEATCAPFEKKNHCDDEMKILCCDALSTFCVEKRGRDLFLSIHGPQKLYELLEKTESIRVRDAAARLVQQLCSDSSLAESFVRARYLDHMTKHRLSCRVVPSWETCIEALYDANLPVKFAFARRLSLHDITKDGFYVMRRTVRPFPILEDLFRLKMSPREPIYVSNFATPDDDAMRRRCSNSESRSSTGETGDATTDEEDKCEAMYAKFGELRSDPFLCEYLDQLKCELNGAESKETAENGSVNARLVASRAELLGKFVARQLSGPSRSTAAGCVDHQLELHVNAIKRDIETSVVPLGQLRVGSYLERALLFKVLADRICLPAALVRGQYGKAWIEIAVPETKKAPERARMRTDGETGTSEWSPSDDRPSATRVMVASDRRRMIFPAKLLRPNYIVDLMHQPGRLIPTDSDRARNYRGEPSV